MEEKLKELLNSNKCLFRQDILCLKFPLRLKKNEENNNQNNL